MEDDRDLVTFTDEEGNDFDLEVIDYLFYQGEEYAVLVDADEEVECEGDCEHHHHDHDHDHGHDHGHDHEHHHDCGECEGHEQEVYIMKVLKVGDDMEEFVPIEDDIADALIEIVRTRFEGDFDADDEYDEDEDEEDEEDDENKDQ